MFVKTKFTGTGMWKYMAASILVKIILFIGFIMASISYGVECIDHIQSFTNDNISLDLYFILKQIGWIILNFIIAVILEVVIVFLVIFPIAKAEMNNNW